MSPGALPPRDLPRPWAVHPHPTTGQGRHVPATPQANDAFPALSLPEQPKPIGGELLLCALRHKRTDPSTQTEPTRSTRAERTVRPNANDPPAGLTHYRPNGLPCKRNPPPQTERPALPNGTAGRAGVDETYRVLINDPLRLRTHPRSTVGYDRAR